MPTLKTIGGSRGKKKNSPTGWTSQGNNFYHSPEWRRIRKQKLQQKSICEYCEREDNRITKATVIDHLRPVRLYPELKDDINNLRSSCKKHHYSKNTKSRVYSREAFEKVLQDEGWK